MKQHTSRHHKLQLYVLHAVRPSVTVRLSVRLSVSPISEENNQKIKHDENVAMQFEVNSSKRQLPRVKIYTKTPNVSYISRPNNWHCFL